ncbi:hypothetical protein [Hymenobacter crusticola]|uniref:Uncharacterized protein n=1 Tax=Hymenobacter crusticola TaxID=1770526 RepID=A0A243W6W9_9BACT|nr:hypothetical protein [Hymenobacter crusticola]OUJ70305.1 hypothetical protein BXP70_24740 [Hymenobacter crusticola]
MNTIQFIGAYGYNRPQTLTQCVQQVVAFLVELNQHNAQLYGNWFEKAHSKKAALLKPVSLDYASILKAFTQSTSETSFPETRLWQHLRPLSLPKQVRPLRVKLEHKAIQGIGRQRVLHGV